MLLHRLVLLGLVRRTSLRLLGPDLIWGTRSPVLPRRGLLEGPAPLSGSPAFGLDAFSLLRRQPLWLLRLLGGSLGCRHSRLGTLYGLAGLARRSTFGLYALPLLGRHLPWFIVTLSGILLWLLPLCPGGFGEAGDLAHLRQDLVSRRQVADPGVGNLVVGPHDEGGGPGVRSEERRVGKE